MVIPQADQPHFPEGYGVPKGDKDLLPWSHARERLNRALIYWIGTVRPDGRPSITPVWGVWIDESLYFDGGSETRRVRNLLKNPAVTVHLDSGGDGKDVVILEGDVHRVLSPERSLTERLSLAYTQKYLSENYAPSPDQWDSGGLYRMMPKVAFAWTNFLKDPTRWHFD